MFIIRSLLFVPFFYLGSIPFVLAAFIGTYLSTPLLRKGVRGWAQFHRFAMRWILGIEFRVEGGLLPGSVLYAVKHESFMETIDMPRLFNLPAVVTKRELFDIPFWGTAAKAYGMIPVDRNAGAKGLRAMILLAREIQAGEPADRDLPRRHTCPAWRTPAAAIGLCRIVQTARPAGGADCGEQRHADPQRQAVVAQRHHDLQGRRNHPARPATRGGGGAGARSD